MAINQVQETQPYNIKPDSLSKKSPADNFINSLMDFKNVQNPHYSLDSDYQYYSVVKDKQDVVATTGLSEEFVDKLINFEGCKLEEYKDARGIPTIGFGHNIKADCTYNMGGEITQEQAYQLLAKDLLGAKRDIKTCIGDVKLNKNQEEALTELFYNAGYENIKDTKLIEHIKSKDFEKAACEFDFIGIGKNVHHHLCERRIYDTDKFCSGKYTPKTLKALTNIYDKGVESLDNKYEKSGILKKGYYWLQKGLFIYSQKPIIDKANNNVEK